MRILFIVMMIFAFWLGGQFVTYLLGGVVTLLSFIFMIETIPWLKRVMRLLGNVVDILLFAFAIYASVAMSVTVAMTFAVVGLGYTMAYKPYLMGTISSNSNHENKSRGRYRSYREFRRNN